LSWSVAILGVFLGLFMLAKFGMVWIPSGDRDPGWFLRSIGFAGVGLFGLGFLAGSIAAPRNSWRAGVIFLASIPIVAFCAGYPDSGFLVKHADGSGWFEAPLPMTAIGLTAVFYLPFVAPLLSLHNKKRAAAAFAAAVLVAVPVLVHSHWAKALVPNLAVWSVPFGLFGLFWLGTYKLGWPSLIQARPRTVRGIAGFVITCLVVLCLDVTFTLWLSALGSSLFSGDCGGKPPSTHSVSSNHAVFTARVIFVGRSFGDMMTRSGTVSGESHGSRTGDWAIAIVQERFWGLPRWPRLVLLTDYVYWMGETYFIDGAHARGLLTRFLPIVGAGIGCSRSRPVQDAIVDLRLLNEPAPEDGTRLIGYVREPEIFSGALTPPTPPRLAAGARIDVIGPTGTKTITTDASGIYQIDGLLPGDYTLQLSVPSGQIAGFFGSDGSSAKVHLAANALVERNFHLFWNGRIAGHIKGDSGKPAHIWVMLQNADGSTLPGNVRNFLLTTSDGSYEITKIPPGRYTVMVNPYGPTRGSPYPPIYYPSGIQPKDASVFAMSEGQDIENLDFSVTRLAERNLPIRVTWPDGRPIKGAWLYAAYDGSLSGDFQSAHAADTGGRTDENGASTISLFGGSRVRVFAQAVVDDSATRYSAPSELRGDKLPSHLDLVIDTSESRMQALWRNTNDPDIGKRSP